jgi:hypothetical protein
MKIETETVINAPSETVWRVLMDFEAYPEWNPFVRSIAGRVAEGERLTVRLHPPGGMAMTFRPRVRAADPPREFRWLGHLVVPGLFDGEHRLVLESLPHHRTRFVNGERFSGVLVPVFRRLMEGSTRRGFDAMNAALKARVENAPAG